MTRCLTQPPGRRLQVSKNIELHELSDTEIVKSGTIRDIQYGRRRRINPEEKTKVVAAVRGTEFSAALAILH